MAKKTDPGRKKSRRGFAAMSPEKQREIAAAGGRAMPAGKRSFSVDRDLAARAGAAGGAGVSADKRKFATDPEFAQRCGRLRWGKKPREAST